MVDRASISTVEPLRFLRREKNVIIVFTVPAFLLQLLNFCQGPGTPDKPKRDPQLTNIWATHLVQLKASEMPYM